MWTSLSAMHAGHQEHTEMLCSCNLGQVLQMAFHRQQWERTRDPEGQAEGCCKDAASRQGAHSPHCMHQSKYGYWSNFQFQQPLNPYPRF